jgi:hypothetical protein
LAWAARRSHAPNTPPPVVPSIIVSVTPSSGGFTAGAADGTVISAINVLMSPSVPAFTGTLSLTGADAASFKLSSATLPSNLETNGVLGAAVYNLNIVATQVGATGSPFTQPVVVTGSAGDLLSTLTLVNTSASAQAADFISPMFGWVFHKGDIPAATAPLFKNGSTPQPYSWGLQSYWSDGSLKFASFMLRSTAGIAGNGSVSIGVWSGGTAPAAGARTLTEVYAESLIVNVTGAGAGFGLAGDLGGWLRVDANNVEQFVYLDGDAGKVWRVLTHMAPTIGGTRHGQIECYHYVAALTDASGNLGGFRYLPCVAQPWYNDITVGATPIPKAIRSFTTVNWQHGAGPTTVPLAIGATAITFTHVAGASVNSTRTGSSDFYSGSADNSFNIPCLLTTSGTTLPSPLTSTEPWYCRGTNGSTTISFAKSGHFGSSQTVTGAGDGTNTATPLPTLNCFGRLFMPTVDGRWNYFQGAGSIAAEPTVRTTIDQNYWHGDPTNKLSLIPPYDLALVGLATDPVFTYNWTPYGVGSLTVSRSGGGGNSGRQDLGGMQGWQGIDFLRQTANSERRIRINAFPGVHDINCIRNSANGNIINLRGVAHTGMTMLNTAYWKSDTNNSANPFPGSAKPPTLNVGQIFDQSDNAHKPAFFYWPYLRTGEPQFLDCLIEMAAGGVMDLLPTYRNTTGTNPGNYTGIMIWASSGGDRGVAWGHRDLQNAASVCPLVMPDESDLFACLNGLADDTPQAMIDIGASTTITGSYGVTNHFWDNYNPTTGSPQLLIRGFGQQYTRAGMAFAAGARENANALTWLENEALWEIFIVANFGYFCTTTYFGHNALNFDANAFGFPMIGANDQWGTTSPWLTLTWNGANNPAWTVGTSKCTGTALADGDKFIFNTFHYANVPSPYVKDTAYYVIQRSGSSFNLTTVAGSAADIKVPAGSGNFTSDATFHWYVPVTDVPAIFGSENTGYVGGGSYMSWKRAQLMNFTALGATSALADHITDASNRSGAVGTNAYFLADVRNAYQDHFGA